MPSLSSHALYPRDRTGAQRGPFPSRRLRDGSISPNKRRAKNPPSIQRILSEQADADHASVQKRPWLRATGHYVSGILLLPCCALLLVVLLKMILWKPPEGQWLTRPTLWFLTGSAVAGALIVCVPRRWMMLFYVAGHEWTHWIFVRVCGGKTGEISIRSTGGYVMASKTNWIINLSPYFFPFWAVISWAIYNALAFAFLINTSQQIFFQKYSIGFSWSHVGVAGLGLLWTLHVFYTLKMINSRQPDLHEQGTFFSLIIIVFFNLLLMNLLYVSFAGSIRLNEWWKWVVHNGEALLAMRQQR